jgi:PleD family two-component response regulator
MREREPIVITDLPGQATYGRPSRLRPLVRPIVRGLGRLLAALARRLTVEAEPVSPHAALDSAPAMVQRAGRSCTPARVLLVAADRRFRELACTLLTQRGCWVTVHERDLDVRHQAARDRADVVVLDATGSLTAAAETAARLRSLRPHVGLVPVSSDPRDRLCALPVIPKWGTADVLFLAIERARQDRRDG